MKKKNSQEKITKIQTKPQLKNSKSKEKINLKENIQIDIIKSDNLKLKNENDNITSKYNILDTNFQSILLEKEKFEKENSQLNQEKLSLIEENQEFLKEIEYLTQNISNLTINKLDLEKKIFSLSENNIILTENFKQNDLKILDFLNNFHEFPIIKLEETNIEYNFKNLSIIDFPTKLFEILKEIIQELLISQSNLKAYNKRLMDFEQKILILSKEKQEKFIENQLQNMIFNELENKKNLIENSLNNNNKELIFLKEINLKKDQELNKINNELNFLKENICKTQRNLIEKDNNFNEFQINYSEERKNNFDNIKYFIENTHNFQRENEKLKIQLQTLLIENENLNKNYQEIEKILEKNEKKQNYLQNKINESLKDKDNSHIKNHDIEDLKFNFEENKRKLVISIENEKNYKEKVKKKYFFFIYI